MRVRCGWLLKSASRVSTPLRSGFCVRVSATQIKSYLHHVVNSGDDRQGNRCVDAPALTEFDPPRIRDFVQHHEGNGNDLGGRVRLSEDAGAEDLERAGSVEQRANDHDDNVPAEY